MNIGYGITEAKWKYFISKENVGHFATIKCSRDILVIRMP
jgi:hypothetical protein